MSYYSRLSDAFTDAPSLPLTDHSLFVLVSDCHRGNGTTNDNFMKNQNIYYAAMNFYLAEGYTYIELGDGDELWENRRMRQITEIHSEAFCLLNKFYQRGRLYMLYGNHDIVKKKKQFLKRKCPPDRYSQQPDFLPLITNLDFYSGIILSDPEAAKNVYLTHGHQVDLLNSVFWPVSRFLVRYVWRVLESIGFADPTSAAKNNTHKKKAERRLTNWAVANDSILVTGHTHRPMLGTPESPYFNTGSCVHPRCITCIEVENRCFKLVKWVVDTRADRTLYVSRQVIAGPVCVEDYIQ